MLILGMAETTTAVDIIVWSSPAAFGLALYLAHDAFKGIKEDIKELKERQVKTREEVFRLSQSMKNQTDNIAIVQRGVDANMETTKRLSEEYRDLNGFMAKVEKQLQVSDENYGKVILILRKVVAILRPKPPPTNQQPPQK